MTAVDGFTANLRNTRKIVESERAREPKGDHAMTAVRVFGRRDRLVIQTVKATLLVTALARFTAIALRAGLRQLSHMIW